MKITSWHRNVKVVTDTYGIVEEAVSLWSNGQICYQVVLEGEDTADCRTWYLTHGHGYRILEFDGHGNAVSTTYVIIDDGDAVEVSEADIHGLLARETE